MLKLTENDKRKQMIEEMDSICTQNHSFITILGGGVYGKIIEQYLRNEGVQSTIRFSIDDAYIGKNGSSEEVIPFSVYLKEYAAKSPLVFGFYNYGLILQKKESYKDQIAHMYDFHITVVFNRIVDWNLHFVKENLQAFEQTYEMLSDEKSRNTMEAYLNAAIAGEFDALYRNCRDAIPYFDGILKGRKIDRLFDCGAYDGDSAHDFIQAFPDYENICEFEPDAENVKKIRERVKRENIRDLSIVQKGVWSQSTTLRFMSEGKSSSGVSSEGDVSIEVIKLDDLYDQFTRNSLIKMDIEGSELEALKGAEKVISEKTPMLAICVYHKTEDLITIPQYISHLVNPGTYQYYLGFQGDDLAELVFYAIPEN